MIQALETAYNNYRFRSRLEARWAVFFDALHIAYEYEPEGYKLKDGSMYLPDFRLQNVGLRSRVGPLWLEVKPTMPSEQEERKLAFLVGGTKVHGVMVIGTPWGRSELKRSHDGHYEFAYQPEYRDLHSGLDGSVWDVNVTWDNDMVFCKCHQCGRMKFDFADSSNFVCDRCGGISDGNHPAIVAAEAMAKQARFGT